MVDTWSHLCNANNSFSTLPLTQDCNTCGTDYRVQTLRYGGVQPANTVIQRTHTKVAALFQPKPTYYEHQEDYNDRHG